MAHEFESLDELLAYRNDFIVLNLLDYVAPLLDTLADTLLPEPPGIYARFQLDPIVDLRQPHYLVATHMNSGVVHAVKKEVPDHGRHRNVYKAEIVDLDATFERSEPLTSVAQLKGFHGEIWDAKGNVILNETRSRLLLNQLADHPYQRRREMSLATLVAVDYMNAHYKYARLTRPSAYEDWIKPEFLHLAEQSVYQDVLTALTSKLVSFVGDDNLHLYFYRRNGANLVVEKNIDYRIFAYYNDLFTQHETTP